jgi:hypothetical protein
LLRDPKQWQIVIHDHHAGYIKWQEFERNQTQLRNNTAAEAGHRGGAVKAGPALLSGLMRCGRCGRMMHVRYQGRHHQFAYYDCMGAAQGLPVSGGQECGWRREPGVAFGPETGGLAGGVGGLRTGWTGG